jgi:hypothetical protein
LNDFHVTIGHLVLLHEDTGADCEDRWSPGQDIGQRIIIQMDANNYNDIWGKHLVHPGITCDSHNFAKNTILKNVKDNYSQKTEC